ncbi:acyl-CoA carboxylase epsilon subunit [Streptomyces anulatus]|uniref:acyl-CoA carboxylase epsilon subunit n=1 Tax=Streptomyces anulatus TaxID=1892 RepID=UPI0036580D08
MKATDTIRVEKGAPSAEELAALAAVLLARTGPAGGAGDGGELPSQQHRTTAQWRRPERSHRSPGPRSWRV